MINYPVLEQLKDIVPIFGLAVLIGILVFFVDEQMPSSSSFDFIRLVFGTFLGLGSYITISILIRFSPFVEFRALILKR